MIVATVLPALEWNRRPVLQMADSERDLVAWWKRLAIELRDANAEHTLGVERELDVVADANFRGMAASGIRHAQEKHDAAWCQQSLHWMLSHRFQVPRRMVDAPTSARKPALPRTAPRYEAALGSPN